MQGTPTEAARGLLAIHPEVQRALAAGEPVVALESSIIAQGMPYPVNVATA
ncbi:MAG: pseudouridine-5'-phosphate glycosidase, partial [Limnochordales bacterium]